uniref:Gfo/Idh/MocA family protein n=1 Tax=Thaumasiovibrio occultus TaxID=1891184 RepID=UPI000B364691|nr:Gfo/Idh/MocA family oxidoreductase [Thaumasiovibrio occultus]
MKIALVGLGDIAAKAYLPVITQMPGIELVFCTRNANTLASLASQYRITDTCTDYQQVMAFKPDAVMIHSATAVHYEMAAFFLSQGVPTFVDKPLASTAQQVETLYEQATKAQLPLYVGFNRRHIPLYNQYLTGVQQGALDGLRSLRWEKHRHQLPGELNTFIFDDFIHPLDSINVSANASLDDVHITYQTEGSQLARLDVQWQVGQTLLHASMNRQFGVTQERVQASYCNEVFEFDSFTSGTHWIEGKAQQIAQPDWTPMLASKGFHAMLQDWVAVVDAGKLAVETVNRNIASHQLTERLYQQVRKQIRNA